MSDIANATELPDVGALKPPSDQSGLPDVESLQPPSTTPMRGMKGMPTYPQAVLDRLAKGDPVTRIIKSTVEGIKQGFGGAFPGLTPEHRQQMVDAGIYPSQYDTENPSLGGMLRFFNQSLLDPIAAVGDSFMRMFPAAVEGTAQGVTQVAKEAGADASLGGTAEQIGREAASAVEFMGTDAGIQTMLMSRAQYADAVRIERNPEAGTYHDVRVGPVPTLEEVPGQAAAIAQHYGIPQAAAAIEKTYHDAGVLPAEVHADIPAHPEILGDLAAGEVPKVYVQPRFMTAANQEPGAAGVGNPGIPATEQVAQAAEDVGPRAAANEPAPGAAPAGSVPTEPGPARPQGGLRPIQGTGETMTPALPQKIEAAAIEKGFAESFPDMPTRQRVDFTQQSAKIAGIAAKDPQLLEDVALGLRAAPKDVVPELVLDYVERKAHADGNVDLLRQLATGSSSLANQSSTLAVRLRALGERDPTNPVAAIQTVQDARAAALKAKGVDVAAETDSFVKQEAPALQAVKQQTRSKIPIWEQFMQTIKC